MARSSNEDLTKNLLDLFTTISEANRQVQEVFNEIEEKTKEVTSEVTSETKKLVEILSDETASDEKKSQAFGNVMLSTFKLCRNFATILTPQEEVTIPKEEEEELVSRGKQLSCNEDVCVFGNTKDKGEWEEVAWEKDSVPRKNI